MANIKNRYTSQNGDLVISNNNLIEGKVKWQSPSNIALIKYWGKYGNQLPQNPSLSISLKNAYSDITIEYFRKKIKGISLELKFDGENNKEFEDRIINFLNTLLPVFPFLNQHSATYYHNCPQESYTLYLFSTETSLPIQLSCFPFHMSISACHSEHRANIISRSMNPHISYLLKVTVKPQPSSPC